MSDLRSSPPPSGSCAPGETVDLVLSQSESVLLFQQSILESVAMGEDPVRVVEKICLFGEQLVSSSVASVMLFDQKKNSLNVFVAPSLPPEAIAMINGLKPGPESGSCANVIYHQSPVFVENTLTDPRWKEIRHLAEILNVCACWSMPVRSAENAVIGTFALSSFESRAPSLFHRKVLEVGAHMIGIVLEQRKHSELLRLSASVMENSRDAIMITNGSREILSVNRAFTEVTGYSAEEVTGKTPDLLFSGFNKSRIVEDSWNLAEYAGHWQGETWNRRKNGEVYPEWLSISIVKSEGEALSNYIAIFSDISERKAAEGRVAFLAHHDPLTELPNRVLLKDRFEQASVHSLRHGSRVGLMFLDLDNFKIVNDSLGHLTGDAVLVGTGKRLMGAVRETDTVSRLGGDEFVIVLTEMEGTEPISVIASKIMEYFLDPVSVGGLDLSISLSIGIAVSPDDGSDFEQVLRKADIAMYHAKEEGKNTYRFYSEKMNVDITEHLVIRNSLRRGLEQDEFVLHYQPQINLVTGEIVGAEVLIRWNHPELGFLYPDRFIPVAEASGMIFSVGEWVLQKACQQGMLWQQAGSPVLIAVNLSALQLKRRNIEQTVVDAVARGGLSPGLLELELTESMLIGDTESVCEMIHRLKSLGIGLAIDDFGTGYSNLSYLKRFDASRIKIDQSFIRNMTHNPEDACIVRTIVQMGRNLGLRTIAEGVEKASQLEMLRQMGCDDGQGFYFAAPMEAVSFGRFLKGERN